MTHNEFAGQAPSAAVRILGVLVTFFVLGARADQVEMVNGDRYVGRVVSLNNETLVLQSEVLGTIRLPRARISTLSLESHAAVSGTNVTRIAPLVLRSNNPTRLSTTVSTNAATEFSAAMRQLSSNSNMIHQVQDQLLTGAGPEAQAKFNDLMSGLMNGKIDLSQLRAEAKSTLAQAKQARGDMGDEGGMLDSYLAILDGFLKETEPTTSPTNTPPIQPRIPSPSQPE